MNTEIYAELKGEGKQQPVFEGLQVQAELRESLAITTITQCYSNAGNNNIEAVYTFPLPLDAVLLEMIVTLGEKTLKGTVLPKQEAEAKYEDAITDGDAPVMLQNPQPGVYTMNVGNLLPGEQAKITFTYGIFMRWQGDTLRYHLPTTIAPRYGSSERAGLEAQQELETSITVDNMFEFGMKVTGALAGMGIESPSHEMALERDSSGRECSVKLVRSSAFMDRDLIITIRNDEQRVATAMAERDGEEYLQWGSFQPRFNMVMENAPRSIKIVVDCSGSMSGDSIAQAREALLRVLDELRVQDWFNVITFGDRATLLFNSQKSADREALSYARGFLKNMDANMGGTEIGKAIDMAVRLRCPEKVQQDILLITDGEIWEWEKIVSKALKSEHRFFTVGVGSAVSEAFVKTLAERTGGACELLSPNENMAERIHRHFKRIGTPRSTGNEIIWPAKPLRVFPEELSPVYDGDTLNQFAWFAEKPVGLPELNVTLPDGSLQTISTDIPAEAAAEGDGIIARMVAAMKLRELTDAKAGQELAVKYQLVSRWTNYLAVVVRDQSDKAETLPELHKVQQMLAAGWGGTGSVLYSAAASALYSAAEPAQSYDMPTFLRKSVPVAPSPASHSKPMFSRDRYKLSEPQINYSVAEQQITEDILIWEKGTANSLDRFIGLIEMTLCEGIMPTNLNLPLLPQKIEDILRQLEAEENLSEQTVVAIFLHVVAASDTGGMFSKQARRVILKAYKDLQPNESLVELVRNRLTIKSIKRIKEC
jgi:Ca-activated chloride channel family protein